MQTGQLALFVNFSVLFRRPVTLVSSENTSLAAIRDCSAEGGVVFTINAVPRDLRLPKAGLPKLLTATSSRLSSSKTRCHFLLSSFALFFVFHATRFGYLPIIQNWLVSGGSTMSNGFVFYSVEWSETEMVAALLAANMGVSVPLDPAQASRRNALPLLVPYSALSTMSPKDLGAVAYHASTAGVIVLRHCPNPSAKPKTFFTLSPDSPLNSLQDAVAIDIGASDSLRWDNMIVRSNQIIFVDECFKSLEGEAPSADALIALVSRLSRMCELRAGSSIYPAGRLVTAASTTFFDGCTFLLSFGSGGKNGEITRGQALRRLLSEESRYQSLLQRMANKLIMLTRNDTFVQNPALHNLFLTMCVSFQASSFFPPSQSDNLNTFSSSSLAGHSSLDVRPNSQSFVWPSIASYLTQLLGEIEEDVPSLIASHGGILVSSVTSSTKTVTHIIEVPQFDAIGGLAAAVPFSLLSEEDSLAIDNLDKVLQSGADPISVLTLFVKVFDSLTKCRQGLQKVMNQIRAAMCTARDTTSSTSARLMGGADAPSVSLEDLPNLEGFVDLVWIRQCVRHWRLFPPTFPKEALTSRENGQAPTTVSDPLIITSGTVLSNEDRFLINCAKDIWDLIKERLPPSATIEGWLREHSNASYTVENTPLDSVEKDRKAQVRGRVDDSVDSEGSSSDSNASSDSASSVSSEETRPPPRKRVPVAQAFAPVALGSAGLKLKSPMGIKGAIKSVQPPPALPSQSPPLPVNAESTKQSTETDIRQTSSGDDKSFDIHSVSLFDPRSPVYYQLLMISSIMPPFGETINVDASTRHLPFAMISGISNNNKEDPPVGWWAGATIAPYVPYGYLTEWWQVQGLPMLSPTILGILDPGVSTTSGPKSLIPYSPKYITVARQPDMEKSGRQPFLLGFRRGTGIGKHVPPSRHLVNAGMCMCDHMVEAHLRYQAKKEAIAQDAKGELNLWYKVKAKEANEVARRVLAQNEQLQSSHAEMHERYAALLRKTAKLEEDLIEERALRESAQSEAALAATMLNDSGIKTDSMDDSEGEILPLDSATNNLVSGELAAKETTSTKRERSPTPPRIPRPLPNATQIYGGTTPIVLPPYTPWQFQKTVVAPIASSNQFANNPPEVPQPLWGQASLMAAPSAVIPPSVPPPIPRTPYYSVAYGSTNKQNVAPPETKEEEKQEPKPPRNYSAGGFPRGGFLGGNTRR